MPSLDKVQKRYHGKGVKKKKPSAKLNHSGDNVYCLKLDLSAGTDEGGIDSDQKQTRRVNQTITTKSLRN